MVELELVRPNLYFLLDSSGSMSEAMPGLVLQDRLDSARNAIELVLRGLGHRVNYGVSVFPADPNSCGPGEEVHATAPGDPVSYAVANKNGPQLTQLVFELHKIAPQGVTPTAAALRALHDTLVDLPGETFLFLLTDGAPNCNEELACEIEQCTANIERAYYSTKDRCDDSINCCRSDLYGSAACLDSQASEDAIAALHDEGVRTFVIGMPGTETYQDLLDTLAIAGGTARGSEGAYYPVTDSEALLDTLQELGGKVSLSCTVELNEVPPDPAQVNVFLDDTLIGFDEVDGWSWLDTGTVQLNGEACELAETGQILQIQVVAGCPVVLL